MEINKQKTKTPMPMADVRERVRNFDEAALGYTEEQAQNEAARCLGCPNSPCVAGCPVGVPIPQFIKLLREKKYEEAYRKGREASTLPAVCGRVCPQERQCESQCVRGRAPDSQPVAIGRLERFMADWFIDHGTYKTPPPAPNGKRVAVVGGGPSGLSCANDLAAAGYAVTLFEAQDFLGGVLCYGIPRFILPAKVVAAEVAALENLGVRFEMSRTLGKDLSLEMLVRGFDAVYIAIGAGKSKMMGIEGEALGGVYSAGDYLYKVNLGRFTPADKILKTAKRALVVGGGDVAMDAARCARRMGAAVTIVYRRDRGQMPCRREEILHAEDEGIALLPLTNPIKLMGERGAVTAAACVKMELTEETDSRGQKSKPIEGSGFTLPCDLVVMALGYDVDPALAAALPAVDKWGLITVDQNLMTSAGGVFAGGDIVTGPATVIKAMGAGRRAAKEIDKYLGGKSI